MRRRRPAGASRRPDLTDRRFERRLHDLRADYLRIEASPELIARIQASLEPRPRKRPRRRRALGVLATVALAFLGGFLFAHTPLTGPHHAAGAATPSRGSRSLAPERVAGPGATARDAARDAARDGASNANPRLREAGAVPERALDTSP